MLPPVCFERAQPIGPQIKTDWPGTLTMSLYWTVRKRFKLAVLPEKDKLLIAVDRHYELFVNGQRVIRQRGFFSGDQYLFAQQWDEKLKPLLRTGENVIDVVVRSDPWQNKNYRCYRPLVWMEAHMGDVTIVTDETWEATVIEGWRELVTLNAIGTIPYERVHVPTMERAVLAGFDRGLKYGPVQVLKVGSRPVIYLWNDPPKRVDVYHPVKLQSAGQCRLADHVLVFNVPRLTAKTSAAFMILEARCNTLEEADLRLAVSAPIHSRIEFNGQLVHERDDVPSKLRVKDYLVPAGMARTKKGANVLRITVFKSWHAMYKLWEWHPFRLAVLGMKAVMNPAVWVDGAGAAVNPQVMELTLQSGWGQNQLILIPAL